MEQIMVQMEETQSNPHNEFVGLTKFLETQLKYYHWGTTSYSEHKSLDKAVDELSDLIDGYVESYQGLTGQRVVPVPMPELSPYESKQLILEDLMSYKEYACQYKEVCGHDALGNIIDEIVAAVGKYAYLLSLNG